MTLYNLMEGMYMTQLLQVVHMDEETQAITKILFEGRLCALVCKEYESIHNSEVKHIFTDDTCTITIAIDSKQNTIEKPQESE